MTEVSLTGLFDLFASARGRSAPCPACWMYIRFLPVGPGAIKGGDVFSEQNWSEFTLDLDGSGRVLSLCQEFPGAARPEVERSSTYDTIDWVTIRQYLQRSDAEPVHLRLILGDGPAVTRRSYEAGSQTGRPAIYLAFDANKYVCQCDIVD